MIDGLRVVLIAPAWNEEAHIGDVARRAPRDVVDEVLVVDDGSTDATARVAREAGARVVSLGSVQGVGAAIRRGYREALAGGFDVAVVIAGNGKDDPEEAPRLCAPIVAGEADFVMGSRWLPGGGAGGDMPLYRRLATRLHPLLVSAATGRRVTESTNGFRALRTDVLRDRRIDLDQRWLDGYDLEVYLLLKLLKLGYRCAEVPVKKTYPPGAGGRTKTKMRPLVDWWRMLRPILLVGLGARR